MRAVVVGAGAVGARAARQLLGAEGLEALDLVDANEGHVAALASSLGSPASVAAWEPAGLDRGDVVVLALPGPHAELARSALG
ncbi:MAG: NAD-binding protein, partial [Acidimicrobiales bacterium]